MNECFTMTLKVSLIKTFPKISHYLLFVCLLKVTTPGYCSEILKMKLD